MKPEMVKSLKVNSHQQEITLDSVPRVISKLINIEILYLSDHNINTIPAEIGSLQKLKELSFAGCKLTAVPDEIFTLKNLKELILLDNPFTEEYKTALKARFKKELPRVSVLL